MSRQGRPSLGILAPVSSGRVRLAVLAALAVALLAPIASGSPASDLAAITRDYARDGNVTSCRFVLSQLENARNQISGDAATYAAGLLSEVEREIKRWQDGRCKGKQGGRLDVRIVRIDALGRAKGESVTIRNATRKTINLRGYALRDAADHTIKLRATKLKAGKRLIVITGCRSGHRDPLRRGERYFACRKREIWDDAGDTVELVNAAGALLAQKTY